MLKLPFQAIRSSFQWAGTALSAVDSVAQLGGNYADSLLEHQSDAADVRSAERQTDLVTRRAELEAKKAKNSIANAMLLENALEEAMLQASVDKLTMKPCRFKEIYRNVLEKIMNRNLEI